MSLVFQKIKEFVRSLDVFLVVIVLACSSIGVLLQYSFYVTGERGIRDTLIQSIGMAAGLVIALALSAFDYEIMAKLWKLHAPIAGLLVIFTYFWGYAPNPDAPTDHAWINLGFTTFQPAELLKLSFILTFALHLSKVGEHINELKPFLFLCLHGMVTVGMVILQSDFGTALVFLIIFGVMMFSAGLSLRWIAVGVGAAAVAAPFVWVFLLDDFLKERFFVAWHPENYLTGSAKGYQQYRGRLALGSGQLFGKGLFNENLYYVPEARNDFIFSYIGQTMGFVGCAIILLLITCLCVKILVTAKMAKDKLGTYICIGVFAMFVFQTVINIGMVLCVIPVIGITLPFFSSGGTSVLISYIGIGMVLSVYRQNRKDLMFD